MFVCGWSIYPYLSASQLPYPSRLDSSGIYFSQGHQWLPSWQSKSYFSFLVFLVPLYANTCSFPSEHSLTSVMSLLHSLAWQRLCHFFVTSSSSDQHWGLNPLLFPSDTLFLGELIQFCGFKYYLYARNSHIYVSSPLTPHLPSCLDLIPWLERSPGEGNGNLL